MWIISQNNLKMAKYENTHIHEVQLHLWKTAKNCRIAHLDSLLHASTDVINQRLGHFPLSGELVLVA